MKNLIIPIFTLLFFSCGNHENKTTSQLITNSDSASLSPLILDSIVENEKVSNSSSTSYAYFFTSENAPLIIFLDPQKNGSLPLKKYNTVLKEYKVNSIGSQATGNGIPYEQQANALQNIMNDVIAKSKVDNRRIYLVGFSGGARVASVFVTQNNTVNGIGLFGAGLGSEQAPKKKTSYFLSAGTGDFNYTEVNENFRKLSTTGLPVAYLSHKGSHEWPDEKTFEKMLQWFLLNEMKDRIITGDSLEILAFIDDERKIIQQNTVTAPEITMEHYQFLIASLEGLVITKPYIQLMQEHAKSNAYKKWIGNFNQMQQSETDQKNKYLEAIIKEDISWWEKETQVLHKKQSNSPLNESNKRMLGFLSITAYTLSNSALNKSDFAGAEKYLDIYSLVDPDNSEHAFLKAVLWARQKKYEKAMLNLEHAAKLGFNDPARIATQPDLTELFNRFGNEVKATMEQIVENSKK